MYAVKIKRHLQLDVLMKKESIPPSDCDDRMVVLHLYSVQNNHV